MGSYVRKFEHLIANFLILVMTIVVVLGVADLAWLLLKDIMTPPILLLEIEELLDLFGFFLLIMIGIELLETLGTNLGVVDDITTAPKESNNKDQL